METIVIDIESNNLGRIIFILDILKGDFKSFNPVKFKLDSGSDFTTVSAKDLYDLGYTREFLEKCPEHIESASTASEDNNLKLQYITNVSIKFGDRELQGCRIFFALDTNLRSLFGTDILKYFNWEVNYDTGILQLTKTTNEPKLSPGEVPLQIYTVEV